MREQLSIVKPFNTNPISISYTGWKRYKECAQKHYLVMTGHRPSIVDERNFLNGQVIHKVLERWFANDAGPQWISEQSTSVWNEYIDKKYVLFKSEEDRSQLLSKCQEWASSLVTMIEGLGFDKSQCQSELALERYIEVGSHRVRLHGYLDILAPLVEGPPAVLDLKCSASRSVMDPYQLVFYSLLLEDDLTNTDRHGAFILPAFSDVVAHHITAEHRSYLLADIRRMAEDIIAGRFDPSPETANCFWCEVKHACPVMGRMPASTGRINL